MNFSFKTKRDRRLAAAAVVLAAALGLVACRGDNDGGSSAAAPPPPPATTPASIPTSAGASVPAFVIYAATLPQNDNQEPLLADAVATPTSETEEPIAV
ncbi:MAG: hypothetical protein H7232_12060 [Aeromicrobium sp.]|nr:hypothetical protein [Burkholderiales bacterium]